MTAPLDVPTTRDEMMDALIEELADIPRNVLPVLVENCVYIAREKVGANAIGLRFMRFRPARELRDTLAVAERLVIWNNRMIDAATMPVDWERPTDDEAVNADEVCEHLRSSLRVHDSRASSADCPPGYTMPPYPIRTSERDALLVDASEKLLAAAHRCLPGAVEGWAWQPSVAIEDGSLVVKFTPRNRNRPTEDDAPPPPEPAEPVDPAVAEEERRREEDARAAAAARAAEDERRRLESFDRARKEEEAAALAIAAGTPTSDDATPVSDVPPAPADPGTQEQPPPLG